MSTERAPDDLTAQNANDVYLGGLATFLSIIRDSTWQVQASMVAEFSRRYDPTPPRYVRRGETA